LLNLGESSRIAISVSGGSDQIFDAPGPFVIGRDQSVQILVTDPRVSRSHGVIAYQNRHWEYSDNSSSGTFNEQGQRIEKLIIYDRVTLCLGDAAGTRISLHPLASGSAPDTALGLHQPYGGGPDQPAGPAVLRIGRNLDSSICVDDLSVSRAHAELTFDSTTGWWIRDLGSANGTNVNGSYINSSPLIAGDQVTIGNSTFLFDGNKLTPSELSGAIALNASAVGYATAKGAQLISGINFAAERGTLTAIVGPSGAGKSTLLRLISGQLAPSTGSVTVFGADIFRNYEQVRAHVGFVPQADIVHSQLTARASLRFGADLRFPEDVSDQELDQRVETVLASLGLARHADKPVGKLSGGQRKRVSVALELLTEPALLLLDEPTTGLDPGYERSTMQLLLQLADSGKTVIVVTHSVESLDLCSQVIFLAAGGSIKFVGNVQDAFNHFGVTTYPQVFQLLDGEPPPPAFAVAQFSERSTPANSQFEIPYPNSTRHQFVALVKRMLAVIGSDRRALLVLMLSALVPGLLLALITGSNSLAAATQDAGNARTLIGALVVSIGVIGAANGVREVVKELPLYQRERAAGLRRTAYLLAKFVVLGAVTAVQCAVLVGVATIKAGGPAAGNFLPGRLELFFALALTGFAALAIGLLISSIVNTSEKAIATIPMIFVVLWLFSGIVSDLNEQPVIRIASFASPSYWGMGAAASTANLINMPPCVTATPLLETGVPPSSTGTTVERSCDSQWNRGTVTWTSDILVLILILSLGFLACDFALAQKEPLRSMRGQYLASRLWRRPQRLNKALQRDASLPPSTPPQSRPG